NTADLSLRCVTLDCDGAAQAPSSSVWRWPRRLPPARPKVTRRNTVLHRGVVFAGFVSAGLYLYSGLKMSLSLFRALFPLPCSRAFLYASLPSPSWLVSPALLPSLLLRSWPVPPGRLTARTDSDLCRARDPRMLTPFTRQLGYLDFYHTYRLTYK